MGSKRRGSRRDWRAVVVLLVVCGAAYLPGISALPVMDRDEARFAQATRQMIESGDFVNIRFQDEARNKKPAGIHWLQAGSVAAANGVLWAQSEWRGARADDTRELLFDDPVREIAWYRVPSVVGAMVAVVLTYWMGRRVVGRGAAFIGAVLLGASMLVVVEAHLATTDAALLAAVVAAQLSMERAYRRRGDCGVGVSIVFAVAMGAGILLKGPVLPLASAATGAALIVMDHGRVAWVRGLRPVVGLMIVAAMVLPWAVAVGVATSWEFFREAWSGDFWAKVVSAQESHWGWPGYYLVLSVATFWPGSIVLAGAVWKGIAEVRKGRRDRDSASQRESGGARAVRFLVAWVAPIWLAMELIPTKLPHYILPVYPAAALLVGRYLMGMAGEARFQRRVDQGAGLRRVGAMIPGGYWVWVVVTGLMGAGMAMLPWLAEKRVDGVAVGAGVFVTGAGMLIAWMYGRGRVMGAVGMSAAASVGVSVLMMRHVLPGMESVWLSRRVVAEVEELPMEVRGEVVAIGYVEPSLVFDMGGDVRLMSAAQGDKFVAERLGEFRGVIMVSSVAGADMTTRIEAAAEGANRRVNRVGVVSGWNYTKGRWEEIEILAVR